MPNSDWDFESNTGPKKAYLSGESLKRRFQSGEVYKLVDLTFSECDIQGDFNHQPSILFTSCRFHQCDFAFSTWTRVTFRECEFKECSLSLTTFSDCEFRDCTWHKIGFRGSKTVIQRTFINTPRELLAAGYSGTDPSLGSSAKHAAYQRYRLEETKAHLARSLLISHEIVGDDKTYYETARLHDLQQAVFRISFGWYSVRYEENRDKRLGGLDAVFWILEWVLLWVIGGINGWGARLLQPLLCIVLMTLMFGLVYSLPSLSEFCQNPWQKAFDISALAGYTNQSSTSQPLGLRALEDIQLVLSILLYTVFFSTAVARLSRSR